MDTEKMMLMKRTDDLCEQLESVMRERNALCYDMQLAAFALCTICKYNICSEDVCSRTQKYGPNCFVWRGLCKANGGVEVEQD